MIKIVNISKYYAAKCVVDNISFNINEGESICLLGQNGVGKTTIINIISGLLRQTKGNVFIDDEEILPGTYNYRRKFGYVFEEPMLINKLTAKEYLSMISQMHEIPKDIYKNRIISLLDFFNLVYEKDKYIESYSLGMKIKTSLAAAMVHNPKYLILDEPFNGLDISSTSSLINLLKSFVKKDRAIFITSHNLDLVADLCDRFLIMDKGKIVMDVKKSDYESIEHLKTEIKQKITKNTNFENLSWLT